MYNKRITTKFKGIQGITAHEGETIEQKMRRVLNNNEPIKDGAEIIYTERKEGVRPEYDIRTDKFEIAAKAMDKVHQQNAAKRDKPDIGKTAKENMKKEETEQNPEQKNEPQGGESKEATTA